MKGFKVWIIISIFLFLISFIELQKISPLTILAGLIFVVGIMGWVNDDFSEYEKHKKEMEKMKEMSKKFEHHSKKQSRDFHGRFRKKIRRKTWEY